MTHDKDENTATKDYSTIGYYGRPITDFSRDELLAVFAELVDMYKEIKIKNEKCKEVLGEKKFESL
ncbi:hypothetical protein ACFL0M_14665 [Thermodesulfobacteriota bacterium]